MRKGIAVLIALMVMGFVQKANAVTESHQEISGDSVRAIVTNVKGDVVAVEIFDGKGIEIYEFYGDNFTIGEEITLIMIDDKIVGVK